MPQISQPDRDAFVEVLYPRTWHALGYLAIALGFTAIAVWMFSEAKSPKEIGIALFVGGFFGLGALVFIVMLIPGSSYLGISTEGITVRTLWRERTYRWADIAEFGVATVPVALNKPKQMVGMNFSAAFLEDHPQGKMQDLSRSISGFAAALPDTYGKDCAALASYLEQLRRHYYGETVLPG